MKLTTLLRTGFLSMFLLAGTGLVACSSDVSPDDSAGGQAVTQKSAYSANMDAYNGIYNKQFKNLEDAYTVKVTAGDKVIPAPTHLFGEAVNVIPYSNRDGDPSAEGEVFERGDQEIAKVYKKGQLGIAVKHHRSEHPALDFNTAQADSMKEDFKLQDTHIEIVVGVERDGKPGAITINNPQGYEDGLFGDEHYAMVFLRPVYPSYLNAEQVSQFETNIRTMLVGFNTVTNFPGDYNGGDPLAARTPAKVREHVKQMILSIAGTDAEQQAAKAYFADKDNLVYCAELAHLSFSAGLIAPLNDATMVPLVGENAWKGFKEQIAKHNAGENSKFIERNQNKRIKYIRDLAVAPSGLKPAASYGGAGEAEKLAFQPMTMADIVAQFLRNYLPREILGEGLAPLQAQVLQKMKPGLYEQMGLDQLPAGSDQRKAVDLVFDELVAVVGKSYANYAEFQTKLEAPMAKARAMVGPRGDTGVGLFVPPSLYHVIAQGKHQGGLLKLQYEGHGVHVKAVEKIAAAPAVTPVAEIDNRISCKNSCGKQAPGGCWCDSYCKNAGDCCSDQASVCR